MVVLDTFPSAEADAPRVEAALRAGETFSEVKVKFGDKVSNVLDTWIEPGQLDAVLEEAIWKLDVGELTPPLKARGGYHIAQVLEREESAIQSFEDVREQIEREEYSRRMTSTYDEYLGELQEVAYITCKPPQENRELCDTVLNADRSIGATRPAGGLEDVDRLLSAEPGVESPAAEDSAAEQGSGR